MLEIEDPAVPVEEPHVVRARVTVDQAVIPRFVQQHKKLVDLGSGGYGGQAQRDGRAKEGVLARATASGQGGVPRPAHACIDPGASA